MSIELRNKFIANQEKLAEKYRIHTYLRFEEGNPITTYYMELDEKTHELLTLAWAMLDLTVKFNRLLEPSLQKKGTVNDVVEIAEGILFGELTSGMQVKELLTQNGWPIMAATGWALSTNFKANEFPRTLGTKFINIDLVDDCYADIHSSDKPNEKAQLHNVPKGIDPDFRGTGLIEQSIMASINEIIREHKQEQTSEPEAKPNNCSKTEEAGEVEEKEFKREQERLEQKKRAERQAAQEATEKERQDIKYEEPCESEEDYMTPLRREYEQTRRTRSKNHLESNTPPTATATFTIIFALFALFGPGASKPFFGILTGAGIVITYISKED